MHLIAASFDDIVRLQIPVWDKVLRTVVVYALIYLLMRLAKRDAAQLTASDFVVVLLLSNVVQNAIIGADNSLVGGAMGAVTLIVANEVFARWESARKRRISKEPGGISTPTWHPAMLRTLRSDPVPLIDNGEPQEEALRGLGITDVDLFAELRRQGVGDPTKDVEWAGLHTGGTVEYRLKQQAQTATKEDIDDLLRDLRELREAVGRLSTSG
ncbi:MAG: DUF421 domain-containing protein [Actinomycetota bacterium]